MHLYLSSYELGKRSEELSELVVGNKQVGAIRNALEFSRLQSIGLTHQSIDLRNFFSIRN